MVEKSIKGSCIAFLEVKEILEVVVIRTTRGQVLET